MKQHLLLDRIQTPADLKALDAEQLPVLAQEVRDLILSTVSCTGGHLGASLGAVELIIALHRVFQSPRDRILFDVGHQAYAHKLLTGRAQRFSTLRTAGGLSGFPNRAESEHDVLTVGHASTAISSALGVREGLHLAGQEGHVIAVIGDGSLTGGLAFEGLNMAGSIPRGLIVVLNDNGMFIDPTVGALSRWLTTKLAHSRYERAKVTVKSLLGALPHGEELTGMISHALESTRALLTPGILFAALGFRYVGPLDGHDLPTLERVFSTLAARQVREPVLVHVTTSKGRGYQQAEDDPCSYHGVGPFDCAQGVVASQAPATFTDLFGQAMTELGARDERVIAITAAMVSGTGLGRFHTAFPERTYDVGIAEGHAVTFAGGLARAGRVPVVAVYSTFLQRCIDQVIHDVALQDLPVVLAIDRAGLVGADGATHQGAFDIALLRAVPGLVLMAPADGDELRVMLATAVACGRPVAIRYPRARVPAFEREAALEPIELGRGRALRTPARPDVVIVSYGHLLGQAVCAADQLAAGGIEVALLDARFAKPLDAELIADWAGRARALVTLEEGCVLGGFGAAVLECLAARGLAGRPTAVLGLPDRFIEHGDPAEQRRAFGLDAEGIAAACRGLLA